MSLKNLNFVSDEKPQAGATTVDPVTKARNKMTAALDLQIAAWEAHEKGEHLTHTVRRQGEDKEVPVREWFWARGADHFISIKYGTQKLPISGKNSTIQVGKAGVGGTLKMLKKAVEAGELDKPIAKVTSRMSAARVGK